MLKRILVIAVVIFKRLAKKSSPDQVMNGVQLLANHALPINSQQLILHCNQVALFCRATWRELLNPYRVCGRRPFIPANPRQEHAVVKSSRGRTYKGLEERGGGVAE
jgi:hypothetical protein